MTLQCTVLETPKLSLHLCHCKYSFRLRFYSRQDLAVAGGFGSELRRSRGALGRRGCNDGTSASAGRQRRNRGEATLAAIAEG
ncbi:hypothetical protein GW17_00052234 [Ensete ventricosum]|nr:hypothetical protein GW17_00052234 [Ensete ventricosum]